MTKKEIFFTAVDFFSDRGFKQCTMQEIADKVNIKTPSIYKHFTNKKEILAEIFDYYKDKTNVVMIDGLDSIENILNKEIAYLNG